MKIAVIGSRELKIRNIDKYIPKSISLLISGGAKGVDALAESYADDRGIKKMIIKPDYKKFRKSAPLIRNKLIIQNADYVIAIWNGVSKGTKFAIDYAKCIGKFVKVFLFDITGIEIIPENAGKNCPGNGENGFEICCDECDYLLGCINQDSYQI